MFWQNEMIRENVGLTLDDTYQLQLPDFGLLGSLMLRISGAEVSGLGASGGKWRIIDFISKLEVIQNGATVCKSLKGDAIQALTFYDDGVTSPDSLRNYATNTQYCYLLINFGRKVFDLEAGLDLNDFKTVELKLTNDATASEFSDLTLSVMGMWAREHTGGFGYFMRTEEWRKWSTVQDETQYLELPSQYTIRRLILQAVPAVDADNLEKTGMHNLMDDVDLSMRSGQTRIYKGGIDDILRLNLFRYGKNLFTGGFPYMTAGKGINMGLGYTNMAAFGAGDQAGSAAGTIPTMESGRTSYTQKPVTYEADHPIALIVGGMAYHNTCVFGFDYNQDPGTWLDPEKDATVKLDVHTRDLAAAASGTAKVILDRAVPSPKG